MEPDARADLLTPECLALVREVESWGRSSDLNGWRAAESRRRDELGLRRVPDCQVEIESIPTADGSVEVWVYTPPRPSGAGVLVWFHGGGWIVGSPELSDDQVRLTAQASGCVVLSVDYRLAPEHRFPRGFEDCCAAVVWAQENLRALVPGGGLAVGGDSAGGNLAAATTIWVRDQGRTPISHQLLVYPVLSAAMDTCSYGRYAEGFWLTADALRWMWGEYLSDPADARSPYASPLAAHSLANLPPATVIVAGCDPLRDEGVAYADRLRLEGVSCDLREYPEMVHGFMAVAGRIPAGETALLEGGRALREALLPSA